MVAANRLSVDDGEWAAFVAAHPHALPFHLAPWIRTVADSYSMPAFVLAVRDGDGRLVAGMPVVETRLPFRPKRWACLPFTDYCPPLSASPADEARLAAALLAEMTAHGVRRADVRGPMTAAQPFREAGYRHVLALADDPAGVYAGFHPSQVQRSIRRAEREGVQVRTGTADDDLMDTFYRLHLATRRRLGVPIQPRRFFEILRERILAPGIGRVMTAEHQGRPIAAALFMEAGQTVVYKYGASDSSAWKLRPNHLLFWAAIQRACTDGYRSFDFGRTDEEGEGLRAFKLSWGAREDRLVYHALGDVPPARAADDGRGGVAVRALAGVIRRSPDWVCRWSGELLYRFAA